MITSATTRRPAWVEIDLGKFRRNLEAINATRPPDVGYIAVVKDEAYGHGAAAISKVAVEYGAEMLAVSTVDEALELRKHGVNAPILIIGERTDPELELCAQLGFVCCISNIAAAKRLAQIGRAIGKKVQFQVEIDTGMSRYGVSWRDGSDISKFCAPELEFQGVFTHFAMSDELDKSFAHAQVDRFNGVLEALRTSKTLPPKIHMCNSGGFLDLPDAHFTSVRLGLLPLGVYPSQVCQRIAGIEAVMTVKTQIAMLRRIEKGDNVGYGLRYSASETRMIAVLPVGYGDGYPRLRNHGHVLVRGQKAPIVGSISMDAVMVDVTEVAGVTVWDEVVLMGKQFGEEITARQVAEWKGTVSYEVLTSWRSRLPRVYV